MAAFLNLLRGEVVGEQGWQAVQRPLGGRVDNWQLQGHVLLGQILVLVATSGALVLDLNANLQHVGEVVAQFRGQLLLDGLLEDEEPLGGILLCRLQELLALCHQPGHTLPQTSETGDLVGLVAGQSPDLVATSGALVLDLNANPQQSHSPAVQQPSQESADSRAGQQEIGATVGVACGLATVLQLEKRLLRWQPDLLPCPLQLLADVEDPLHSRLLIVDCR